MGQVPVKRALLRYVGGGNIEILLGLVIIAVSVTLPAFTANNALLQVVVLVVIPLLRFHPPVALIPLCAVAALWVGGLSNHVLLSGFIVYLAIEYAVATGQRITATILSVQWLLLAYGITAAHLPTTADVPAIMVEVLFVLLAVTVGQLRLKSTRDRQHNDLVRQHLEQELRSGLARYLHDSVARSLTMMSMQAEVTEMATTAPETRQQLRSIVTTGRSAIADLHKLVDHLIDTNPRDSATMLGLWHTASIGETIESAAQLLSEAGYQVTATGIDAEFRLPRTTETAFALVFNEVTANLVKHSPRGGPVSMTVRQRAQHLDIDVINSLAHTDFSSPKITGCTGVGLTSISTRMREINGHAEITTTRTSWQVTLSLPITHD